MMSSGTINVTEEASDSKRSNYHFLTNKPPRHDNSVSSFRFNGVLGHQNGHCGAQIYANQQQIWPGTFKSEREDAMAYDSAGIMLRSGDPHRNFPWTYISNITVQEEKFRSQFNEGTLINMIKDGSYPSKLADFVRAQFQKEEIEVGLSLTPVHAAAAASNGSPCRQNFQKVLSPSDVKLYRLVIPKKHALKYFPLITQDENGGVANTQLVFYDSLITRSWEFRYSYLKSCQSFVFTRGWNRFVKEKGLKAKDMVIFSTHECEGRSFRIIDASYSVEVVDNSNVHVGMQQQQQRQRRGGGGVNVDGENEEAAMSGLGYAEDDKELVEDKKFQVTNKSTDAQRKGFRLFGVQIVS